MLNPDTGAPRVASTEPRPAHPECAALLRLACARLGVESALIVSATALGRVLLAGVGAGAAPAVAVPADPFAAQIGSIVPAQAAVCDPDSGRGWTARALRAGDGEHLATLFLFDAPALDAEACTFLDDLAALAGPALDHALAGTMHDAGRVMHHAPPTPSAANDAGNGSDATTPRRIDHASGHDHDLVALALTGSGTGIWDRDVVSGAIRYSAEWKAILGYAPHELGDRIEDAVDRLHPDDRAYVQAAMRAHFDGDTERYEVEHRIRCKDGSYKWICSRGKAVSHDAAGRALRMVGTTTDITAQREAAARLQHNIDLITNLTDEVDGLVFQYRETARGKRFFSYASRGIEQIYELQAGDVAASAAPLEARIDGRDLATYRQTLRESAAQLTPWRLEFRVRLPRQGLRWRHGEARPQRTPDGGTLWHGFITDTTERKRIEAELHALATVDHLTELANRRDFMSQSAAVFARLRQAGNGEAAVLMLDLDHFKSLNDRWGHALGDRALRHFAQLLRQEARSADIVGRIGGEEFAVVLPGLGVDAAVGFGRRLQRRVSAAPLAVENRFVELTVSIGVDRMTPADLGVDQVLTRCDKALYLAKARGRNRVELYGA